MNRWRDSRAIDPVMDNCKRRLGKGLGVSFRRHGFEQMKGDNA
jgi:hypothetical protein